MACDITALLLTVGATAVLRSQSLSWVAAFLAAISLATILLYGYDKAIAGSSLRRVPERVLHVLALAGGSPAALLARHLFRHKTAKRRFRRTFWAIVGMQVAAAAALLRWG